MRSTDGKVLGYDKHIKMGLFYGKVLGTIIGHVYGITKTLDVGKKPGSLDVSFDGSNNGKFEFFLWFIRIY